VSGQFLAKLLVSAAIIVAVSEIAKRSTFWGALVASLPLTSLLAFVWLYVETGDTRGVASLSLSIFWLVLASLPLFVLFAMLLRAGWSFWMSLMVACAATAGVYVELVLVLKRLGVPL
jgi:hypothetical protein